VEENVKEFAVGERVARVEQGGHPHQYIRGVVKRWSGDDPDARVYIVEGLTGGGMLCFDALAKDLVSLPEE
jgi:hypothetical protein